MSNIISNTNLLEASNNISNNSVNSDIQVTDDIKKLDFSSLENSAMGFVNDAYNNHNFLVEVLQNETPEDLSPEMLRKIQNKLEEFAFEVPLISKTASALLKGIETLTKIQ